MPGSETHDDVALTRWRDRLEQRQPKTDQSEGRRSPRMSSEQPRTVAEAAAELGLSVHTVRAWIADRRIGHIRLGRAIRISSAEIRRIIEQNTVPALRER
jgi:excisionase family DNA binding protein